MTNREILDIITEIGKSPILKEAFLSAMEGRQMQTPPIKKEEPKKKKWRIYTSYTIEDRYDVEAYTIDEAIEEAKNNFVDDFGYDCTFNYYDVNIDDIIEMG